MAIVSSPENLRRLDHYRDISRRLALAEGLTDAQARALAAEGKAIVWIDGGLHANEVLGAQQLIETVYQLVSGSDEETQRFLRDVIVLAVHANPDGHELVANWYMRERDPSRRTLNGIPRAYQKYVGHDNNRDFYMSSQAETINMNRILYREWFPQIVYDHHQTGPPGTVMFAPPFRDPFNYFLDPLIPDLDRSDRSGHARALRSGGQAGRHDAKWLDLLDVVERRPADDGILSQSNRLADRDNRKPDADRCAVRPRATDARAPICPNPIAPQRWRFRQSIDYSVTANRAVIDAASRYREALLFGSYRMGKNSIERGNRDSWTVSPRDLSAAGASRGRGDYERQFRDPARRDARAYILPVRSAGLPDGHQVHRCTAQDGHNSPSCDGGLQHRWQGLSVRVVCRQDRAGFSPARARHVRATGPSRRHSLSRCVRRRHPMTMRDGRSPSRWA